MLCRFPHNVVIDGNKFPVECPFAQMYHVLFILFLYLEPNWSPWGGAHYTSSQFWLISSCEHRSIVHKGRSTKYANDLNRNVVGSVLHVVNGISIVVLVAVPGERAATH